LIEYWRILARRKGTLITIVVLGTLAGFLFTLPQMPVYQARTTLEIVGLNENFLNVKESSPLNEGGASSDTVDLQTQVRILQSESLLQRVITKMRSDHLPVPEPAQMPRWRQLLKLPNPAPGNPREEAMAYAKKHLKVRIVGQTRILEITVDSTSPSVASGFANTLASEFIDQNLESRWKTTERTGEWLTRQLDDMRVRLRASEDRLQAYARDAGLMFTDDHKNSVSEEKLRQVQTVLSSAQADRIAKESRLEMAKTSPAEALPDVLNDQTLRDYQAKITELNRQYAELSPTYKADYPKVQRVQAQIVALQAALDRERSDVLKRIQNEYDEALHREKLLTKDYAAQRTVVTGESERSVQYNILNREVESNRQLYDTVLQQLKQSTLASALRASNIRVVDGAMQPGAPYEPDVPVDASLGLLSGLFLGVALVVTQERADRSIQAPGETPQYLHLPELGIVPADGTGIRVRVRITSKDKNQVDSGLPASLPAAAGDSMDPSDVPTANARGAVELVTWYRKTCLVAESFRAVLVSILFTGDKEKQPRVLVVTSSSPSEGKSTVVSNLGIALAEVNRKVLLIDADVRRPRLHTIFKLKNESGLSDLLRAREGSGVSWKDFIHDSGVPNLYIMTSGSSTSAATSLLYSTKVPELLVELQKEFQTVLLDTPPMLQIPDARVLGRMADAVILVVRAGQTTRDAAIAAGRRFSEDGTPVLGTILNDWNPKHSVNGYYGYSNSYYKSYKSYGLKD
jgi:capsular exopolysaccharide synthesis family protein